MAMGWSLGWLLALAAVTGALRTGFAPLPTPVLAALVLGAAPAPAP